ncbi:MAG: hypothetical protein ACI8RD_011048 [Bacillariaceae sp.]|jgi:hypothetical protein
MKKNDYYRNNRMRMNLFAFSFLRPIREKINNCDVDVDDDDIR